MAEMESSMRFWFISNIFTWGKARKTSSQPAIAERHPPVIKISRMVFRGQGISKIRNAVKNGILNNPVKDILSFQNGHVVDFDPFEGAADLKDKDTHDDDSDEDIEKDSQFDQQRHPEG